MIPEIDVKSLVAKRKYEGELAFDYEPESGLNDIPFVAFSSPVRAKLRYEILEDDGVEVRGNIAFSLKGACSRCLSDAEEHFLGEVEGLFVKGEGDGETYGYTHTVRLEELLRDSLLFALPARLLCERCRAEEEESQ